MDRILFCRFNGYIAASNSLLLLLAYTEASLDDNHDYRDEALSIALKGPSKYNRKFKVVHPRITHFYQIFQENVTIENGEAGFEPKPREAQFFNSYNDYYRSLVDKLEKVKQNYSSRHRKWPFTPFTTLSTGYDSTAVSCLVKDIGIEACFIGSPLDGLVFKRPEEQSARIGEKLGFNIHKLDSSRKNISRDELYFLTGNYPKYSKSVWSEISLHSMAKTLQKHQSPAAIFMGYCGDDVWGDKSGIDPETGDLLHSPPISGSNLAEIRLHTGFITISPAYMFWRNIYQIKNISKSREMDPWRLNNNYDRPIPRRIAEEMGIPREWFGIKKRHITTTYYWPINGDNRKAFFRHLKKKGRLNKWLVSAHYLQKRFHINILGKINGRAKNIDCYDIMRKWATEVLKNEYAAILKKQPEFKSIQKNLLSPDSA